MVLVTKRPVDGSFRVATEVVDLVRLRAHVLRLGAPFLGRLFTRAEVAASEGSAVDVIASLGTGMQADSRVISRKTATTPAEPRAVRAGPGPLCRWSTNAVDGRAA